MVPDQEKIMTAEDRGAGRSVPEPVDALVEEFRGFLSGERGLAPETVRCYGSHARAFLAWLPQPTDVALAELSAGLVTGYVEPPRARRPVRRCAGPAGCQKSCLGR